MDLILILFLQIRSFATRKYLLLLPFGYVKEILIICHSWILLQEVAISHHFQTGVVSKAEQPQIVQSRGETADEMQIALSLSGLISRRVKCREQNHRTSQIRRACACVFIKS